MRSLHGSQKAQYVRGVINHTEQSLQKVHRSDGHWVDKCFGEGRRIVQLAQIRCEICKALQGCVRSKLVKHVIHRSLQQQRKRAIITNRAYSLSNNDNENMPRRMRGIPPTTWVGWQWKRQALTQLRATHSAPSRTPSAQYFGQSSQKWILRIQRYLLRKLNQLRAKTGRLCQRPVCSSAARRSNKADSFEQ